MFFCNSNLKCFATAIMALALSTETIAAKVQTPDSPSLTYADVADLVSNAPVVAIAKTSHAKRLKGDLAVNLSPGYARYLVEARVTALLRGDQGIPARITYLLDLPLDAANRSTKPSKQPVIIAALPVAGKPDFLQLAGARGAMPWSPEREEQVRKMLRELVAPDSPPRVEGVGNAFHVAGSLPGESETQIFLKTSDGRPISLAVLRRPGEETRWAVALGEMVDESAQPPAPETILWYRLACFLPAALPAASLAGQSESDAVAANMDYRYIIESLGPCGRTPRP